jgi:hypothetical protein
MRWIRAARPVVGVALVLVATSCGAGSASGVAPGGSLTLSGSMTGRVTAGVQNSDAACFITDISTTGLAPPPPTEVTLTGTVDLSADSSSVALRFTGAPGTFTLPLSGELTAPGPPGFVEITGYGSSEWAGGQSSPASSGTLTLSTTPTGTTGTIHGSVDAWLAPLRATTAPLHVVGTWSCSVA